MAVLIEGKHNADFIVSEANGARSRDAVTVAQSAALKPGTVLGKLTASGKYAALDPAANTGAETAIGLLYAAADATDADAGAVAILRDAEVNGAELAWPEGITPEQKAIAIAALAIRGIIVR